MLAEGSPVVKKGGGHLCCHKWILLFRERHAWHLSISLLHPRKVEGQQVPYLWIQGSPAIVEPFAPTSIHEVVIFCLPFCDSAALIAECYSACLRQFIYFSSLQAL